MDEWRVRGGRPFQARRVPRTRGRRHATHDHGHLAGRALEVGHPYLRRCFHEYSPGQSLPFPSDCREAGTRSRVRCWTTWRGRLTPGIRSAATSPASRCCRESIRRRAGTWMWTVWNPGEGFSSTRPWIPCWHWVRKRGAPGCARPPKESTAGGGVPRPGMAPVQIVLEPVASERASFASLGVVGTFSPIRLGAAPYARDMVGDEDEPMPPAAADRASLAAVRSGKGLKSDSAGVPPRGRIHLEAGLVGARRRPVRRDAPAHRLAAPSDRHGIVVLFPVAQTGATSGVGRGAGRPGGRGGHPDLLGCARGPYLWPRASRLCSRSGRPVRRMDCRSRRGRLEVGVA